MSLGVVATALVSPIALDAEEHAFFVDAEVTAHSSGAYVDREGIALPVNDCGWIPAARPWESRVRLLARQALARVGETSARTPIVLIGPESDAAGDAELERFLALDGRRVVATLRGSAAFTAALHQAGVLAKQAAEVIVLAVDSLIRPAELDRWVAERESRFSRAPLPPSEGAAALRLTRSTGAALVGRVLGLSSARSQATDDNDLPGDHALSRCFAELPLPPRLASLVGPGNVDLLRNRDLALATAHHHDRIVEADSPTFEGRVGRFGSAGGLMALVFAHAWLRHGMIEGSRRDDVALAWARSADGTVGAALIEDVR